MTTPSTNMSGALRSQGVCAASSTSVSETILLEGQRLASNTQHPIDRATESNVAANKKAAEKKLKMPVLAIGSRDFIGKEVEKQMQHVGENVQYKELHYGHQLAEECPNELAKIYRDFLQSLQ